MGGKNSTQSWILQSVIGNTNRAVGKGFHTKNLVIMLSIGNTGYDIALSDDSPCNTL